MGRKKHKGPREANGRLSRAKEPNAPRTTEEPIDELAITMRANKQAELWGLKKTDREGKSTLRDEKRGSYIGILRMLWLQSAGAEGISEGQYQAGMKAKEIRANFAKAIASPAAIYDGTGTGDEVSAKQFYDKACDSWDRLKECVKALQIEMGTCKFLPLMQSCVFEDNGYGYSVGDVRLLLNAIHREFMEAPKRKAA